MMNEAVRKGIEREIGELPDEAKANARASLAIAEEVIAALEQGKKRDWMLPIIMAVQHRMVEDSVVHAIMNLKKLVEGLEAVKHDLAVRMVEEINRGNR